MKPIIVVLLLCAISLIPAALRAQPGDWSNNRDASWSYSLTSGATNTIATAGELAQFAYLINQGHNFTNTVTVITESIDLAAYDWTPAGHENCFFQGTLTARPGVVINGLTIVSTTLQYTGLFGIIGGAGRVDAVSLTHSAITASFSKSHIHAGGITGYNDGGTIVNCSNSGEISASSSFVYSGGITGLTTTARSRTARTTVWFMRLCLLCSLLRIPAASRGLTTTARSRTVRTTVRFPDLSLPAAS